MSNFYNYLILHNVCPEYTLDILQAKELVEKSAPHELAHIQAAYLFLPGRFNRACSLLFNGREAEKGNWKGWVETDVNPVDELHDVEGARIAVSTAVAALGTEEMFDVITVEPKIGEPVLPTSIKKLVEAMEETRIDDTSSSSDTDDDQSAGNPEPADLIAFDTELDRPFGLDDKDNESAAESAKMRNPDPPTWPNHVRVVQEISTGLEIIAKTMPSSATRTLYKSLDRSKIVLYEVGVLHCKPWIMHDEVALYDHPPGYDGTKGKHRQLPDTINLWFEEQVLVSLRPGMKMQATIRQLDFGGKGELWVVEEVQLVLCTFYKPLLNDLLPRRMKPVRWLTKEDAATTNRDSIEEDDNMEEDDEESGSSGGVAIQPE
jgi:hypothetical protein